MEYAKLWLRLHEVAKTKSPKQVLEHFYQVIFELNSMKKSCHCNKDAVEYFEALLCDSVENINKLSQRGLVMLICSLHNLVNLKLGKKIFFPKDLFII